MGGAWGVTRQENLYGWDVHAIVWGSLQWRYLLLAVLHLQILIRYHSVSTVYNICYITEPEYHNNQQKR